MPIIVFGDYFVQRELLNKFHQGELYDAYKHLGCSFNKKTGKAVFRVWAPRAERVFLVGDFNEWCNNAHYMIKDETGIFELEIDGVKEYDSYKYYVITNGKGVYKADPYALHSETEGRTNSKVFDLSSIKIRDKKYMMERKNKDFYRCPMNIYEVHIGSWRKYADGNFFSYRKFADEIVPYLKEMNYTHLELLGISEHPFDGSWGYQVTSYFAPTARYGNPKDFAYLIQKCHNNSIGVILDWVPGHFPKDEFGLLDFDGYPLYEPSIPFRQEHKGWGTRCFDYGRAEVQSFLCSSADLWLNVYHVDALRVDAVASMLYLDYGRNDGEWEKNSRGDNKNIESVAFLQKLNTYVRTVYPDVMMIAEESTSWPNMTKPVEYMGLGFHYKWNMGWMNDILSYVKTAPIYRGGIHDKLTFSLVYAFNENYVLPISHDEVVHGKCSLINKMPGLYDNKFAGLRNFLMHMYAHPGKKLLFMGTEFGQFIEWDYKKELDWLLLQYPHHQDVRNFVKTLNRFYKYHKALWDVEGGWDGFEWLVVDDNTQNVIIYQRKDSDGNKVIAIINFSDNRYIDYRFGVDEGTYTEVLHSHDKGWLKMNKRRRARKIPSHNKQYSLTLDIPPMSGIYLTGKN